MGKSWDGSEDAGEHMNPAMALELDSWDVAPPAGPGAADGENPPALRVSLLARLPEIAVRAVAHAAGLPNWDWLDPRCGNRVAATASGCSGCARPQA